MEKKINYNYKKMIKTMATTVCLLCAVIFYGVNVQASGMEKSRLQLSAAEDMPLNLNTAAKTPVKKQYRLETGKSLKLSLKSAKGKVTWKSSKPSVASVSAKGVVKAKTLGKTKITAKYRGKIYTCTINVVPQFKIDSWYAFTNGGYYFEIHSIKGNKMKFTVHMPNMTFKNKIAVIKPDGKTASVTLKCKSGKKHSLTISTFKKAIKIKEVSSCKKKLLSMDESTNKRTIRHTFKY